MASGWGSALAAAHAPQLLVSFLEYAKNPGHAVITDPMPLLGYEPKKATE